MQDLLGAIRLSSVTRLLKVFFEKCIASTDMYLFRLNDRRDSWPSADTAAAYDYAVSERLPFSLPMR